MPIDPTRSTEAPSTLAFIKFTPSYYNNHTYDPQKTEVTLTRPEITEINSIQLFQSGSRQKTMDSSQTKSIL